MPGLSIGEIACPIYLPVLRRFDDSCVIVSWWLFHDPKTLHRRPSHCIIINDGPGGPTIHIPNRTDPLMHCHPPINNPHGLLPLHHITLHILPDIRGHRRPLRRLDPIMHILPTLIQNIPRGLQQPITHNRPRSITRPWSMIGHSRCTRHTDNMCSGVTAGADGAYLISCLGGAVWD